MSYPGPPAPHYTTLYENSTFSSYIDSDSTTLYKECLYAYIRSLHATTLYRPSLLLSLPSLLYKVTTTLYSRSLEPVTVGFPSLLVLLLLRSLHGRSLGNFWSLGLKFKKNLSISPKPVDITKCLKSLEKIFFNEIKRLAWGLRGGVVFVWWIEAYKSLISLRKFCSFLRKNTGRNDRIGVHTYATEPSGTWGVLNSGICYANVPGGLLFGQLIF